MANTVTIRLNKEERQMLEEAAKVYDCSLSSMIKRLVFEKIEDEIDLSSILEYEEEKRQKTLKLRPAKELWSELGIDE